MLVTWDTGVSVHESAIVVMANMANTRKTVQVVRWSSRKRRLVQAYWTHDQRNDFSRTLFPPKVPPNGGRVIFPPLPQKMPILFHSGNKRQFKLCPKSVSNYQHQLVEAEKLFKKSHIFAWFHCNMVKKFFNFMPVSFGKDALNVEFLESEMSRITRIGTRMTFLKTEILLPPDWYHNEKHSGSILWQHTGQREDRINFTILSFFFVEICHFSFHASHTLHIDMHHFATQNNVDVISVLFSCRGSNTFPFVFWLPMVC